MLVIAKINLQDIQQKQWESWCQYHVPISLKKLYYTINDALQKYILQELSLAVGDLEGFPT